MDRRTNGPTDGRTKREASYRVANPRLKNAKNDADIFLSHYHTALTVPSGVGVLIPEADVTDWSRNEAKKHLLNLKVYFRYQKEKKGKC